MVRTITPLLTSSRILSLDTVEIKTVEFKKICKAINPEITKDKIIELQGSLETSLTYFQSMENTEDTKIQSKAKKEANANFKKAIKLADKLRSDINAMHEKNDFEVRRLIGVIDEYFLTPKEGVNIEDMVDRTQTKDAYEYLLHNLIVIAEVFECALIDIPAHAPKAHANNFLAQQFWNIFNKLIEEKKGEKNKNRKQIEYLLTEVLKNSTLKNPPYVLSIMRIIDGYRLKQGLTGKIKNKPKYNPAITQKWN